MLATGRYETAVTSGNAFARGALEKILPVPRASPDGGRRLLVTLAPFYGPCVSLDEPLGGLPTAWATPGGLDGSAPGEPPPRSLEHDSISTAHCR